MDADAFVSAIRLDRRSLKRPSVAVDDYLQTLHRLRLVRTVDKLAAHHGNL
jgi:hypothetical protein